MSRKKNNTGIPNFEIDSLARLFIPAIQKFFESEEVKKEFEMWKRQRDFEKQKIYNLLKR